MLVLLLGLGLLDLLHRDVEETAEKPSLHLHIGPERRLVRAILDAASNLTDTSLGALPASQVGDFDGQPLTGLAAPRFDTSGSV